MKRALMISAMTLSLGLIGVGSSHAAPFTAYTSQATWEAAAGTPIVVEDFADTTLVSGLTITFGNNIPAGSIAGGVYNDVASTQFNDANNPKLSFAPGTLAFGADFDLSPGGLGDGLIVAMTFADATTNSYFIGSSGFFGFVSGTAFTSIRFDSPFTGVESFSMDNLRFLGSGDGNGGNGGNGGAVPEPSSLLLLGAAVAGLGLWRKYGEARS